ncbi:MAG: hypothetical protein ACOYJL_09060 [Tractidigestivibacter sp.]|uniref:hypothetical protein n=1 Tax=Tractidigestivibacter sp. TaxID=2847320 RepID=UPI003D947FF8
MATSDKADKEMRERGVSGASVSGGLGAGAKSQRAPRSIPAQEDAEARAEAEFIRAENEDDDGYDPYSDRRPAAEPLFERDPWD